MAEKKKKLSKKLTLFDLYAVSTGAMFSSGFFLLPGIAAMETGNAVYLAYLAAAFLILPSMFSVAELSTAMPKAGGTYYFLDRSLGPLIGTIGGLGSWIALVFKSSFALIGMGAYLTLFVDLPILPLALVLTVAFGLLNIFGAKETALLQRILVASLVVIMAFFVIQGLNYMYITQNPLPELRQQNFFTNGINGFISTIGLVFVSYAGLTKATSIAEEVQNPDKVIPLGMMLSLLTASIVYVVGVYIMVNVLPAEELFSSLTPVADAGKVILDFLPGNSGLLLVVIAAIAAFASTGNAGIMSASRYPLAMSRDNLISSKFGIIGKFKTPHISVLATTGVMLLVLLLFDVEAVAKLASAFQLLLFFLINLSVIVMRESKIEAYKPGYKSPLYPWVQIAGMVISLWLVAEMGLLAVGLTGTLIIICIGWYFYYSHGKVKRQGAIYHIHARLGQMRYEALEHELMTIINEKNLNSSLTYEEVIARSIVNQVANNQSDFDRLILKSTISLSQRLNVDKNELREGLFDLEKDFTKLKEGVYFNFVRMKEAQFPEMVAIQSVEGITLNQGKVQETANALIFLVTPSDRPLLHMRIIGHLAELIEAEDFLNRWKDAQNEKELKQVLLSDERFIHVRLQEHSKSEQWIGNKIMEIDLPGECLIAIIERNEGIIIPKGNTLLESGDVLSILGYPNDIKNLKEQLED
ncbi:MAG: amino acid permease [Balneolaceae bacterium]|nr:amino acid permease [Balneolaceae bacterium]MBO6546041.1 amino acid permease [Balneolaceae bacterium]MBO6647437.1 amino acid permease [Balneolaceae bacterium]